MCTRARPYGRVGRCGFGGQGVTHQHPRRGGGAKGRWDPHTRSAPPVAEERGSRTEPQ
jgi:hypothetical protein